MAFSVVMPQLGESVVEGTITRWHVKVGDAVRKDQTLVTVSTDKADLDVPSPAAGVVTKLLSAEGQTVPTQTPIAELSDAEAAPAVGAAPAPTGAEDDGRAPRTTPAVRKLALELGVDLASVRGTGENARVTRQDVLAAAGGLAPLAPVVAAPEPAAPARVAAIPVPAPAVTAPAPPPSGRAPGAFRPQAYVPAPGDEVVPFSRRRRIIADHMVYSKQVAPHVYTFTEVDLHRVSRLREARKGALKAEGIPLTFLAFIAAAVARALREHPQLNARVLDDAYVKLRDIHLGVAVETPGGLLVPVVRHADQLTVKGLARAIDAMARKAREGKVEADDLAGATFTLSNPGPKGNFVGAAVISQPNVGILRTGEIAKRPVVVEADGVDSIAIHPVMFAALSYDHRVVDGVAANDFLFRVTELLEAGAFEV
jgi:2-oxoglutarate dehydrogenase E2 component (dihydrolipoamide succinyltransferase)